MPKKQTSKDETQYVLKVNVLHDGAFLKKGSICPKEIVEAFLSKGWIANQ